VLLAAAGPLSADVLSAYTDLPAIAVDGGIAHFTEKNPPFLWVGDGDSGTVPDWYTGGRITLPHEKDMTDTEAAATEAVRRGYNDLVIAGGLGGRLDHVLGNLAVLELLADMHVSAALVSDTARVRVLVAPHTATVDRFAGYLSLYALDDSVVTLTGVKYPLKSARLPRAVTLGISNEVVTDQAVIELHSGTVVLLEVPR
ncbi:MAG: thiamine diphosphokinase, partial [Clostridiales bacterium]|jgi:thiamine pyrophosphokinase|nr:thiamine diphosphokinase [Clostridiales bacterium]